MVGFEEGLDLAGPSSDNAQPSPATALTGSASTPPAPAQDQYDLRPSEADDDDDDDDDDDVHMTDADDGRNAPPPSYPFSDTGSPSHDPIGADVGVMAEATADGPAMPEAMIAPTTAAAPLPPAHIVSTEPVPGLVSDSVDGNGSSDATPAGGPVEVNNELGSDGPESSNNSSLASTIGGGDGSSTGSVVETTSSAAASTAPSSQTPSLLLSHGISPSPPVQYHLMLIHPLQHHSQQQPPLPQQHHIQQQQQQSPPPPQQQLQNQQPQNLQQQQLQSLQLQQLQLQQQQVQYQLQQLQHQLQHQHQHQQQPQQHQLQQLQQLHHQLHHLGHQQQQLQQYQQQYQQQQLQHQHHQPQHPMVPAAPVPNFVSSIHQHNHPQSAPPTPSPTWPHLPQVSQPSQATQSAQTQPPLEAYPPYMSPQHSLMPPPQMPPSQMTQPQPPHQTLPPHMPQYSLMLSPQIQPPTQTAPHPVLSYPQVLQVHYAQHVLQQLQQDLHALPLQMQEHIQHLLEIYQLQPAQHLPFALANLLHQIQLQFLAGGHFVPAFIQVQTQLQTQVQAQSQTQAQTQAQVQAHAQTQAETQGQAQVQEQTQVQTQAQAQTQVQIQAQTQAQAFLQANADFHIQVETQILEQVLAHIHTIVPAHIEASVLEGIHNNYSQLLHAEIQALIQTEVAEQFQEHLQTQLETLQHAPPGTAVHVHFQVQLQEQIRALAHTFVLAHLQSQAQAHAQVQTQAPAQTVQAMHSVEAGVASLPVQHASSGTFPSPVPSHAVHGPVLVQTAALSPHEQADPNEGNQAGVMANNTAPGQGSGIHTGSGPANGTAEGMANVANITNSDANNGTGNVISNVEGNTTAPNHPSVIPQHAQPLGPMHYVQPPPAVPPQNPSGTQYNNLNPSNNDLRNLLLGWAWGAHPKNPRLLERRAGPPEAALKRELNRVVRHVRYEDLHGDKCDFQGINWASMGVTREQARARRSSSFANYVSVCNSDKWTACWGSNNSESYFKFREMHIKKPIHLAHFQLRNLLACTSRSRAFYASRPGIVRQINTLTGTDSIAMRYSEHQEVQISTIAAGQGVLVAGGFVGEYCITNLDSEYVDEDPLKARFEGTVTSHMSGISNHIEIHSLRGASGPLAAFASNDLGLRVMDLNTEKILSSVKFPFAVNCTAISPDRRLRVVVGDALETLIVAAEPERSWVDSSGTQRPDVMQRLLGHRDYGFSCAWAPDGFTVATGNQDRAIKIWDARMFHSSSGKPTPVASLCTEMAGARSLHFSPAGSGKRVLVAAEEADYVNIIDAQTFKPRQTFDIFGEIAGMTLTSDGQELMVLCADSTRGGLLRFERCGAAAYMANGDESHYTSRACDPYWHSATSFDWEATGRRPRRRERLRESRMRIAAAGAAGLEPF